MPKLARRKVRRGRRRDPQECARFPGRLENFSANWKASGNPARTFIVAVLPRYTFARLPYRKRISKRWAASGAAFQRRPWATMGKTGTRNRLARAFWRQHSRVDNSNARLSTATIIVSFRFLFVDGQSIGPRLGELRVSLSRDRATRPAINRDPICLAEMSNAGGN